MSYVMVDVEADGPIPGDYSMVCFGAVIVEPALERTFYATLAPISEKWVPEALQVSGFSREDTFRPSSHLTRPSEISPAFHRQSAPPQETTFRPRR